MTGIGVEQEVTCLGNRIQQIKECIVVFVVPLLSFPSLLL